jgi:hypothetical protein
LAFTSARAFPATPDETENSSYVCVVRTAAEVAVARLLTGAERETVTRERRTVSEVEKRMVSIGFGDEGRDYELLSLKRVILN